MKRITCILLILIAAITVMAQSTRNHIVQRGETIQSIAKKYRISERDILIGNPDAKDNFHVGMQLRIPLSGNSDSYSKSDDYSPNLNSETTSNSNQSLMSQTQKETMHTTSNDMQKLLWCRDFAFKLDPDSKAYGFRFTQTFDGTEWIGMTFGMTHVFEKHGTTSSFLGIGLSPIYSFGPFLVGFHLYPYGGLSLSYKPEEGKHETVVYKEKTEFVYGAMLDLTVGIRLTTTAKGNGVYLSGSYLLSAPKFKTKGMFEDGLWGVGLIFEMNN